MSEQQQETASQTPSDAPSRMDWARLILDFVARSFYPAIIILVLMLLYPSLSLVDWPGLINRLQSAQVGSTQLTFNQAQDVAITIAPLNTQLADMQRTIDTLEGELAMLRAVTGMVEAAAAPDGSSATAPPGSQNAAYTVLVFHTRDSRRRAAAITQDLLAAGYTATSTETDFSELPHKRPPGSIYMTHTEVAEDIYGKIKQSLQQRYPDASLSVPENASELRRGDVQILVF